MDKDKTKAPDAEAYRLKLHAFYHRLPNHQVYDNVDESDFAIVHDRVRQERAIKVDTEKSKLFEKMYHDMGEAPPKAARPNVPL